MNKKIIIGIAIVFFVITLIGVGIFSFSKTVSQTATISIPEQADYVILREKKYENGSNIVTKDGTYEYTLHGTNIYPSKGNITVKSGEDIVIPSDNISFTKEYTEKLIANERPAIKKVIMENITPKRGGGISVDSIVPSTSPEYALVAISLTDEYIDEDYARNYRVIVKKDTTWKVVGKPQVFHTVHTTPDVDKAILAQANALSAASY